MPELRQNIITREWVIIATERARRRTSLSGRRRRLITFRHSNRVRVLPGNESMSAVETYRVADRDGWQVRVVENKFPALSREGDRVRRIDGVYRSMSGVGSTRSSSSTGGTTCHRPSIPSRICRGYSSRTRSATGRSGRHAGRSDHHIQEPRRVRRYVARPPHSQIAATPIVPTQVRHRLDEAIRFFDETGECVFCTTLRRELADRIRIVASTDSFVAFIPFAALSPFHLWIFPVRHCSSFDEIEEYEITDLAVTLRTVLGKLYYGLNDPDYNFSIRSIPAREGEREYFHWYLTVIPASSGPPVLRSAAACISTHLFRKRAPGSSGASRFNDPPITLRSSTSCSVRIPRGRSPSEAPSAQNRRRSHDDGDHHVDHDLLVGVFIVWGTPGT